MQIIPKPCPVCGSENIGVKDNIIRTSNKMLVRQAWAYCKSCGHNNPVRIIVDYDDEKEINEVFTKWNEALSSNYR